MMKEDEAWKAIDNLINKGRVHLYKPIQVAEILHRQRVSSDIKFEDVEDYRNRSKIWRDQVSQRLVGRVSTSSQKYQDNLFDKNAAPPQVLSKLSEINIKGDGIVEKYIYNKLEERLSEVRQAKEYLDKGMTFKLEEFMSIFTSRAGLKRSIDKAYEIATYSAFSAILALLKVNVEVRVEEVDKAILKDFEDFRSKILGIAGVRINRAATIFRAGSTNAADKGLDIWGNFGVAIQVKHVDLTEELADDVAESVSSDAPIVLVCKEAERETIRKVLGRVSGLKVSAIVSMEELAQWYSLCLEKYKSKIGALLISRLKKEFDAEFPSGNEMSPFMRERGYA
jgi:type II restriction enzyme